MLALVRPPQPTMPCPECQGVGFNPEFEAHEGYVGGIHQVGESRCGLCGGSGQVEQCVKCYRPLGMSDPDHFVDQRPIGIQLVGEVCDECWDCEHCW